jgi:hypothetical protein
MTLLALTAVVLMWAAAAEYVGSALVAGAAGAVLISAFLMLRVCYSLAVFVSASSGRMHSSVSSSRTALERAALH